MSDLKAVGFLYTLNTTDECEMSVTYSVRRQGEDVQVVEGRASAWEPEEPTERTISAELETRYSDGSTHSLTLTGSQHISLDECGALDKVLEKIAAGVDPQAALDGVLLEIDGFVSVPRRPGF